MENIITSNKDIRNVVLPLIKPTKVQSEKIMNAVESLINKINIVIERTGLKWNVKVELVGSVAKGTYLKDPDIDVFIIFPKYAGKGSMESYGLKIAKEVLPNGIKLYTQHPYIRGRWGTYQVDLVPCLEISEREDINTMVDRTPLHTKFIKESLSEEKKDEVRLLKAFFKGIKIYGAEEAVKGFSGYLTELLILKYESFERTLHAIKNIKSHEMIIVDKKRYVDLNSSNRRARYSLSAPLIVIDPIDPTRNVGSSISLENLRYTKLAAREYLKKPSLKFFFPSEINNIKDGKFKAKGILKELQEKGSGVLLFTIPIPEVQPDIYMSQARSFMKKILRALERYDFKKAKGSIFIYLPLNNKPFPPPPIRNYINRKRRQEIVFLFYLSKYYIGTRKLHLGPYQGIEKRCDTFIRKWQNNPIALSKIFNYRGRLAVYIRREIKDPIEILKRETPLLLPSHLKESYLKASQIQYNKQIDIEKYWESILLYFNKINPWDI